MLVLGVGMMVWCSNCLEMSDDVLAGYYSAPPATKFPSPPIVKAEKHVNNAVICQWNIIENMGLSFLDLILNSLSNVLVLLLVLVLQYDDLNLTLYDTIQKRYIIYVV